MLPITGNKPFAFWCQKVLPLVYDDSLSYYELLCKVVNYINGILSDIIETGKNVEELSKSFAELESFVTNYFNNTDFQEMVNNKLDQMAEDGTLSELIAELSTLGIINVKTFGAIGDGVADDTEALKEAFANAEGRVVIIPNGTYLVNSSFDYPVGGWGTTYDVGVVIPSNCHILGCGSTIKMIPNNHDCGYNMQAREAVNVIIENLNFVGDLEEHTFKPDTTNEWGYGLALYGCRDIVVRNCTFKQFTGDGIYIGQDFRSIEGGKVTYNAHHITVDGCYIDTVRRNGISLCDGVDHYITNCIIKNVKGTDPGAGIDFETEGDGTKVLVRARVDNLITENNTRGLGLSGADTVDVFNSQLNTLYSYANVNRLTVNNCEVGYASVNTPIFDVNSSKLGVFYIGGQNHIATFNDCTWSAPFYVAGGAMPTGDMIFNRCVFNVDTSFALEEGCHFVFNYCKLNSSLADTQEPLISAGKASASLEMNYCTLKNVNNGAGIQGTCPVKLNNCVFETQTAVTTKGLLTMIGCIVFARYTANFAYPWSDTGVNVVCNNLVYYPSKNTSPDLSIDSSTCIYANNTIINGSGTTGGNGTVVATDNTIV